MRELLDASDVAINDVFANISEEELMEEERIPTITSSQIIDEVVRRPVMPKQPRPIKVDRHHNHNHVEQKPMLAVTMMPPPALEEPKPVV